MTTYIALLRGVNVGGNMLKMERLREIWADCGFQNVRTYIQSGNVIFNAKGTPKEWLSKVEKKLAGETRLPVSVVVRSATELGKVISANPFLKQKGVDLTKLHLTFLLTAPSKSTLQELGQIESGADQFHCHRQDVYLYCPGGYGNTKLSNVRLEKVLGVKATTRNWNTVNTLYKMATE
jgi:uncharacterized protein (DUF1697 family)